MSRFLLSKDQRFQLLQKTDEFVRMANNATDLAELQVAIAGAQLVTRDLHQWELDARASASGVVSSHGGGK